MPEQQTGAVGQAVHERAYEIGASALASYGTRPYGDLRLNAARASAKVVTALREAGLLAPATQDAEGEAAREQAEWDLAITYLVTDSALTCPRQDCGKDLLTDDLPPYEFGTLWDALWRHEAEHDGVEPIRCTTVDLPDVGEVRVQGDLDEQGAAKLAEVAKAAQAKHTEDLKAQGRAELHEQLLALRTKWNTRRAKREAHRETADGPTARLASIEHDIYARILRELDAVLGTGEGR
ncbi:hypothetical protein [Microbispora rosea]|uniref:hypothetical protein n=1 Tax=Microbispora rosea TaxID=58117 RepID=UPI00379CAE10